MEADDAVRPNIARTQVSRDSDRLIDSMQTALLPFVTTYMARGFFNTIDMEQLSKLFLSHAQDQYFLGHDYADKKRGDKTPVSPADLQNMQNLATQAQTSFITSLNRQRAATSRDDTALAAGTIAGLAAVTLGIKALNQGTIAHAEKVEFVTRRDYRVCPICEVYDGKVYDVDARTGIVKDGPLIPVHPNCRCRYLIVP